MTSSPSSNSSRNRLWDALLNSDSDSDEESDEEALFVFSLAALSSTSSPDQFHVRCRVKWESHVAELLEEPNAFFKLYRMTYPSFQKLCSLVHPFCYNDQRQCNRLSNNRSQGLGAITVEIAMHCLLRWLAGGSHLDIRIGVGISVRSFYRACYKCVDAILKIEQLAYHFPKTQQEINEAASHFQQCSARNVIQGCVACLDGLLLRIKVPSASETGHVKSYFSGHYQAYGINIQAACDRYCRFVFAALAAPGGTNDIAAYRKTKLPELIEGLPLGKYVVGDNAYICSEHLLTPFSGDQRRDPAKDAYNFYLSQLRIRIEMTFGLFVNKWRIFRRPLQVELKNTGKLFLCATRLHNYCINEKLATGDATDPGIEASETLAAGGFLPSAAAGTVSSVRGNSMMRDILLERIESESLTRPAYNLHRNAPP